MILIGAGSECPVLTLSRNYARPLLIDEEAKSLAQRRLQIYWIFDSIYLPVMVDRKWWVSELP